MNFAHTRVNVALICLLGHGIPLVHGSYHLNFFDRYLLPLKKIRKNASFYGHISETKHYVM